MFPRRVFPLMNCTHENCHDCPDKIVCRCLKVTEEQLVRMIERLELRSVHDLKKYTGAGDGCTCCHAELKGYLERFAFAIEATVLAQS